jgi:hypothetical protein
MKEHGEHEDLCGSSYQSVITYVHKESVVLLCVWCYSRWELNLGAPAIHPTFYRPRPGSYIMT